jgi:hypothetical protein
MILFSALMFACSDEEEAVEPVQAESEDSAGESEEAEE